ncbi:MAG: hypothetical protein JJE30_12780 [Desulfuromonadales bacterium]|nr:hypothetical protein [Desulfuromonadales bacterium]
MSMPGRISRAAAIISLAVCLWGCGTSNNNSPSFDVTGSHPAGWVALNGGNHRLEFRAHPDQCPKCHGSDILNPVVVGGSGGIANVGCSMTSFNGTICHANGHLPRIAPHPLPFTNPALHGPLAKAGLDGQSGLITCQGCHATSQGGAGTNPRFNAKIGTLLNGCEDCHNLNTAHPTSPLQDNAPWRGPFTHQNARNLANACALCHGANLNGPAEGGDGPACSSCHRASPLANLNCSSCHGNPPDGSTPVGPAFPNIPGAHDVHNTLNNVTGICSTCHNGAGIGTLNHFNQAQTPVVSILAAYNAKTGGAATYLPDTSVAISSAANNGGRCTNVSCHGGVPTPSFRTGAIDPDVNCTTCHQSRTVSDQFNSYFSGRPVTDITPNFATLHDFHLQGVGLICTDCHDTVKLDPVASNHFKFLNTPAFDIVPSTTIRADVNYAGGSCAPANNGLGNFTITICHGTRSWTAP